MGPGDREIERLERELERNDLDHVLHLESTARAFVTLEERDRYQALRAQEADRG